MAKEISNPLDVNLDDMMRDLTGQKSATPKQQPSVKGGKSKMMDGGYRHCSFICDAELWKQAQTIAQARHVSMRQLMEHWMRKGVEDFEKKHGSVEEYAQHSLDDIL